MENKKLPEHVFKVAHPDGRIVYVDRLNRVKYKLNEDYEFFTHPGDVPIPESETNAIDKGAKYLMIIRNRRTGETIQVDVYDVLEAFGVTCSAMGHAIKKLLMAGKRGVKGYDKDCDEGINSINQSKLLQKYRE